MEADKDTKALVEAVKRDLPNLSKDIQARFLSIISDGSITKEMDFSNFNHLINTAELISIRDYLFEEIMKLRNKDLSKKIECSFCDGTGSELVIIKDKDIERACSRCDGEGKRYDIDTINLLDKYIRRYKDIIKIHSRESTLSIVGREIDDEESARQADRIVSGSTIEVKEGEYKVVSEK
jgi:transcription elongation factor Elf1